jgi:hypothetical protein
VAVVNWVKGATHNSQSNFSHREFGGLVTLRARILVIVAVSYISVRKDNKSKKDKHSHGDNAVSKSWNWQFAVLDEHTIGLSK